jgi:hypothetical protein
LSISATAAWLQVVPAVGVHITSTSEHAGVSRVSRQTQYGVLYNRLVCPRLLQWFGRWPIRAASNFAVGVFYYHVVLSCVYVAAWYKYVMPGCMSGFMALTLWLDWSHDDDDDDDDDARMYEWFV